MAMLTEPFTSTVVLKLDWSEESDIGLWEDFLLVLDLIEDKRVDWPEAFQFRPRAFRVLQEVMVTIDNDILHLVRLGVDFPDNAVLLDFRVVVADIAVLGIAGVRLADVHLVDLLDRFRRHDELLTNPVGTQERRQVSALGVNDDAGGWREIEDNALTDKHFRLFLKFVHHQLQLFGFRGVWLEDAVFDILSDSLDAAELLGDITNLVCVFGAGLGHTLETYLDITNASHADTAYQLLHLSLEVRLLLVQDMLEQDFHGLGDLVQHHSFLGTLRKILNQRHTLGVRGHALLCRHSRHGLSLLQRGRSTVPHREF